MEAYFAGGCFWCITPFIKELNGVSEVFSGYCGGDEIDPSYDDVKAQKTGHRETIKVIYDEKICKYETLLNAFLLNVDPYDEGGQFIDRGHSYTLAIYYLNDQQKKLALEKIRQLETKENKKVYIAIEEYKKFYLAEEYHQDFYLKNPEKFEEELIISGRKHNK